MTQLPPRVIAGRRKLNAAQHLLVFAVQLYRWTLSPASRFCFGPACGCRFEPTCSQYALAALHEHGALAGSWLALKRVARCHPWGGCGLDPVPKTSPSATPPAASQTRQARVRASPCGAQRPRVRRVGPADSADAGLGRSGF